MPDFETFDKSILTNRRGPAVTILKGRVLSLNHAAYLALEEPQAVELLFDRRKRIIGLRAVPHTVSHACLVRSYGRRAKAPHLVSAMAFLAHYEIDASESRRWPAWVENDILCINLEHGSEPATSIRGHNNDKRTITGVDTFDQDHGITDALRPPMTNGVSESLQPRRPQDVLLADPTRPVTGKPRGIGCPGDCNAPCGHRERWPAAARVGHGRCVPSARAVAG